MNGKTCGGCAWKTVAHTFRNGEALIGCRRTGWAFRFGKTLDGDHMEIMDPSNIYGVSEPACPAFEEIPVVIPDGAWPKCMECGADFRKCSHLGEFIYETESESSHE